MALSKSQIFIFCCLAFVLGVGVAAILPEEIAKFHLIIFGSFFFVFLIIISLTLINREVFYRLVFLLFFFFFLFGLWRYAISLNNNKIEEIALYNKTKVKMFGEIISEPAIKNNKQEIVLGNLEIRSKVPGRALLKAGAYPKYQIGDKLFVQCKLSAPGEVNGFAYDEYLHQKGIFSICYYPKIEKIGENKKVFRKFIIKIKENIYDVIETGLTEPYAGISKAIILGDKYAISDRINQQFSKVGLSHIVVVSGSHISVISGFVMMVLFNFGVRRKAAFYIAILILSLYLILIGAQVSSIRAGIMGFIALLAMYLGRLNKAFNALIFTAAIMLMINPVALKSDIGFQLSFLSVLSIIAWHPFFKQWFDRWIKNTAISKNNYSKNALKIILELLFISVVVQFYISPVLIYNFKNLSLISPLANLLVLWVFPFLVPILIFAIFFSIILPALSLIFFLPVLIILYYIIFIADLLCRYDFYVFEIKNSNFYLILIYYSALFLFTSFLIKHQKKS